MYFSCRKLPHCFETYIQFQSPHSLSEIHRLIICHATAFSHLFWIHLHIIACMLVSSKNSESTAKYQLYLEKLCWFLFVQYWKFSLSRANLVLLFFLYMSVISILSFPGLPGELLGKKTSVLYYTSKPSCATVVWSKILHIIIVPLFHSSGSWPCNS